MIGKRFGYLLVLDYAFSKNHNRVWRCKCDCGKEHFVKTKYLNSGDTKSCGCLVKEVSSKNAKGMYRKSSATQRNEKIYVSGKINPLYNIWKGMKQRCYNSNSREYKWYGNKGIGVCNEWKDDSIAFINWASSHNYAKGLQIDRIDPTQGYEPSNCEWVTKRENLRRMHERKNGSSSQRKKNS